MAIHYASDDISLLSFRAELKGYSWGIFRQDAFAALSVALLTVPQAMAYALLAGLPLSCGLFAAIYSAIIAALFGSSRHLVVGPSNAIAILVQSGTADILYTYFRGLEGPARDIISVQILTQLSLLVGALQILAAGCKLGRLTQFVSHSVIVGYIAGTAIAVIINQLYTFLGVDAVPGEQSLYEKGAHLITHFSAIHWPTAIVGMGSLATVILFRKISRMIPAPLVMLTLSAVIVHVLKSYFIEGDTSWSFVQIVGDTGTFYEILPTFTFPFFDVRIMNQLLPIAFAICLLSVMETASVAKTIAANSGQRLSINQEIFGIGMGNIFSSILAAMPVSGSASRSNINFIQGAQTRFASVLNAVFVALILYSFNFLIMHIPLTALAAMLLVTATNIVNQRQFFLCLKATSSDAFVLWITLLSCIFFSLDIAFYIGVIISITLYLKKAAIPQLVEYDVDESGELLNLDFANAHEHKTIRIIKVEGELFFGAADLFQTTLKAFAEDDNCTKVIILQLKNARDIDATACLALQQLSDYMKNSDRHLLACGITQPVWDVLSNSGMVEQMGKENLFIFDERHPHLYMLKALHRAKKLIQTSEVPATQAESSGVIDEIIEISEVEVTTQLAPNKVSTLI